MYTLRAGPFPALKAAHLPHSCGFGPRGPSVEKTGSVGSGPSSAPASLSVPDPHPAGSSVTGASEPVGQLGLSLPELGTEVLVSVQADLTSA